MNGISREQHQVAYQDLRRKMMTYSPISDSTWGSIKGITHARCQPMGSYIYPVGEIPRTFSYLHRGLVRCFVCDEKGTEYNKNFFCEGSFPGSMVSLLTSSPSATIFESLEDCFLIEFDFAAYRHLLLQNNELKLFHIHYLEKHWLLSKSLKEIEMVQDDATTRYLKFIEEHPHLVKRLAQYQIASHLGITATQLSRIRKKISENQPM